MLKKLLAGSILLIMLQLSAQSAFALTADKKPCGPGTCKSESKSGYCYPCPDE